MRRLAYLLLIAGTTGIVLGFGLYHARYRDHAPFGTTTSVAAFVFLALTFVGITLALGVLEEPRSGAIGVLSTLAAASTVAFVAVVQLVRPGMLPRFVLTAAAPSLAVWATLCGLVARVGHLRKKLRDRIVAVVTGEEATLLRAEAAETFPLAEQAFTLVDVIDVHDALGGSGSAPLCDLAMRAEATVIVLTEEAQRQKSVVQQAASLHDAGCRIRTIEDFYDQWLGKLPLSSLDRMALLTDIGEVHGGSFVHVKRGLDVAASLIIGVLCVALLPFILLGNVIANRGPLFYLQERVGQRGKVFTIVKFRSMRTDDLQPDTPWTSPNDPRITRFGRVLRRSHLDELPQFLNILRGDLSLVGPRPEQPRYVEELRRKLPFYDLRHRVRPGLTGWAQIKYRYAASEADAFEKLQYDLYYLRHQGIALDTKILSGTVQSILRGRGR